MPNADEVHHVNGPWCPRAASWGQMASSAAPRLFSCARREVLNTGFSTITERRYWADLRITSFALHDHGSYRAVSLHIWGGTFDAGLLFQAGSILLFCISACRVRGEGRGVDVKLY